MISFQKDRDIYFNLRHSFIFDTRFQKYVDEEGMPDFRKWGLSQWVIREYLDKILKYNNKWSFGGEGIEGLVGKWCLYISWIVCGGLGALLHSEWGIVLGILLLSGMYYLVCMILNYIKRKERNTINIQLIERYLEVNRDWVQEYYPHINNINSRQQML